MELKDLLPVAIILVILAFVLTIGQQMTDNLAQRACTGSYVQPNAPLAGTSTLKNPVTGGNFGCCTTMPNATDCTLWTTGNSAINTTINTQKSLDNMSSWTPTIAQVIVAAIIIGILVSALYVKLKE
jgi:hypothetical protein